MKRASSRKLISSNAKRTKLLNATPTLPPRNSFRGLPLELRDQIYAHVCDDLISGPQHPYSDLPLNSRFEDYVTLLLVDKATSDEAKRLFTKEYAEHVVFYFEDACSLYDLQRRWRSISFPRNVQFVLRTRTDVDPRGVFGDGLLWMNETFFRNPCHGTNLGNIHLLEMSLQGDNVRDIWNAPLGPEVRVTNSDHSQCRQKQHCRPYKWVSFPPLKRSLRVKTAVWKMEVSSRWSASCQKTLRKMEDVSVTLFSGYLHDVSFDGFPVQKAKMKLISFLKNCTWPKFLARYEGRYPVDQDEFVDLMYGDLKFDWPLSDITGLHWDTDDDENDDEDDEDDDEDEDESDDDSTTTSDSEDSDDEVDGDETDNDGTSDS